jgi:hypothetical protein
MREATPQWLKVLYVAATIVLLCVGGLSAAWRHGCCTSSADCGDTKICCEKPPDWPYCYRTWYVLGDIPNYCNYDNCDLSQVE